jgi:hypothetical protein
MAGSHSFVLCRGRCGCHFREVVGQVPDSVRGCGNAPLLEERKTMRGIIGTLLCALLLTLTATLNGASKITAASCSASDVQAALNKASAGDLVVIPAGTCGWTTPVDWKAPANVALVGAGSLTTMGGGDATVIIDNYAGASPLITITSNASGTFRLAGITVRGGSGSLKETAVILIDGSSKQMRVDHIHIDMQAYGTAGSNSKPMRFLGPLNGVMDHSIVDLSRGAWLHFQGNNEPGDAAWAAPTGFGGSNFIFIENNQFNADADPDSPTDYYGTVSDCNAGGRFVIRYNTIVSAGVGQTHPTGGSGRGRGCRAHELYGNGVTPAASFDPGVDTPNFAFSYMTSGTMLVWGNTANGVFKSFISLNSTRKDNNTYSQDATPDGWGYCGTSFDGTRSDWDGNTNTTTGYPCLDQPGRGQGDLLSGQFPNAVNTATGIIAWPNQALEPIYEWSNTASVVPGWGEAHVSNGSPGRLAENVDYYMYTSSFDGTVGVGVNTHASRPSTCTKGVAYWSTDRGGNWNTNNASANDGTLDLCTSANTWTDAWYTPYTFPHPLTQMPVPSAPTNLRIGS